MPLMKPGAWNVTIRNIAEQFQNGEVQWFIAVPGTGYDPIAKTYVTPPSETAIGTTAARIQHIREPRAVATNYEYTTYRRFRFQIPYSDIALDITKGVLGRVTDGGDDPRLVGQIVTVQSAVNSSWAAIRTIEALAEGDQ